MNVTLKFEIINMPYIIYLPRFDMFWLLIFTIFKTWRPSFRVPGDHLAARNDKVVFSIAQHRNDWIFITPQLILLVHPPFGLQKNLYVGLRFFYVLLFDKIIQTWQSKDTVREQWLKKRLHCTADRSRANVRKHLKHTTRFLEPALVSGDEMLVMQLRRKNLYPRRDAIILRLQCVAGLQRTIRSPCPTNQLDHAWSVSLKYWTVLNL